MKLSCFFLGLFLIVGLLFTSTNAYRVDDWMIAPIADNINVTYLFGEVICPAGGCKNGDILTFGLTEFGKDVDFTKFGLDIFIPDGTIVMKHTEEVVANNSVSFVMKFVDENKVYPEKTELDFLVTALYASVKSGVVGKSRKFTLAYGPKGADPLLNEDYDWEIVKGASEGSTALQLPIHKGKEADGIIHDFYFSIEKTLTDANVIRVELLGPGKFHINENEACQINDIEVAVEIQDGASGKIARFITEDEMIPANSFIVTDCLRLQVAAPTSEVAALPVNFAIHLSTKENDKELVNSATVILAKFIEEAHVPDLTTNMFVDSNSISCYFGIRFEKNEVVHKDDYVNLTITGVKGIDKSTALVRAGTDTKIYASSQVQAKDGGRFEEVLINMPADDKKGSDMFGVVFHIPADLSKYKEKDEITCRFRYSHNTGEERVRFDDSMTDTRYSDISEKFTFTHTPTNQRKAKFSYEFTKTSNAFDTLLFMTPLLEYVYGGKFATCTLNGEAVKVVDETTQKDTAEFTSSIRVTPTKPIAKGSNIKLECPDAFIHLPDTAAEDVLYNKQLVTVYAYGKVPDGDDGEEEDQWVSSHYFTLNEKDDKKGGKNKVFIYILIAVAIIGVVAAVIFFVVRRKRAAAEQTDMGVGLLDDAA